MFSKTKQRWSFVFYLTRKSKIPLRCQVRIINEWKMLKLKSWETGKNTLNGEVTQELENSR
jgi:hypothetical protein